jgi:hypothetical protein
MEETKKEFDLSKPPPSTPKGIGIPMEVLCNTELTPTEKLLFGFIRNHSGSSKGCWGTNNYFANILLLKSPQTISNAIQKLKYYQYITVHYSKRVGPTDEKDRFIFENDEKYIKMYAPLVRAYFDNYKKLNYMALKDILYPLIMKIIAPYNENYNKDDNKEDKEITSKEVISTSDEVPLSLSLNTLSDKIDRTLYKDSIQPKKPLQQSKPSSDIQSIIDLWEANGLRKTRFGNKTYQDNVKQLRSLLRGTFFNNTSFKDEYSNRKFTVDEIKVAIKRFQNAALDKDYEPTGEYKNRLKGYSISQFIYNPMTTNGERSYLLKCIKISPKKVSQSVILKQIPPQVEPIQQIFKSFYLERLRGGLKLKITPQDENNFRDGAVRLYNFVADYANKIRTISDDRELANIMCDAILDWSKGDPSSVTSAKFKSDHTFQTLLPAKLMTMGILEGY